MGAFSETLYSVGGSALAWTQSKTLPDLLTILTAAIVTPILSWYALAWTTSPLRSTPGPFLAGWTNFWRLFAVWSHRYPLTVYYLHKKYGPVVRVGPNTVSTDFPELIKTVYGTDGKFRKTEFYASSSAIIDGKIHYTLFAEPDHETHAQMKKPVAKYYTTGAALALEPQMDRAIAELCAQLDRRYVGAATPCNLWEWSLYLAWDLSSYIIFSRRLGYLEHGRDFDQSIGMSATINSYFQAVGQMPWLDFWLDKNPVVKIGPRTFTNLTKLAVDGLTLRAQGKDKDFDPAMPDYLQHFIDAKSLHPEAVNDGSVIAYTMTHIIAGADTTAITVSVILYYLLSHPEKLSRLAAEIRAAGFDKDRPVPYNTARQLPYLEAAWLEATRLQPIAGMQYERYVPAEGLTLPNGVFLPPGVAVGLNPYITGRNTAIFGRDAEVFRPERWLRLPGENDESHAARLRVQRSVVDLNFGAGSRVCLGKNLGIVETYKIVATLINRYDMELEGRDGGWEMVGAWVRKPTRLMVKLGLRR